MANVCYTEAVLKTAIRSLINEPIAVMHSDTDLQAYIDDAAQDICRLGMLKEKVIEGSLTYSATLSGVLKIAHSNGTFWDTGDLSDCILLESVIYMGAASATIPTAATMKALVKTHTRLMGRMGRDYTADVPVEYYDFGGNTYIFPAPSNAITTYKVKAFYYAMAPEYYTAAYNIPTRYAEYAIWYALSRCMEREGKLAQAQQYKSIFDNLVLFSRKDTSEKYADSIDTLRQQDYTQVVQ